MESIYRERIDFLTRSELEPSTAKKLKANADLLKAGIDKLKAENEKLKTNLKSDWLTTEAELDKLRAFNAEQKAALLETEAELEKLKAEGY